MFGLFKKSPAEAELAERMLVHWSDVTALVTSIDGPFVNSFEAANFVASMATTKILTFKKVDPPIFADRFNAEWVNRVIGTYSVDGEPPRKGVIVARLQESFPIYREMFLKTVDPSRGDKSHDNAVQLMWELFTRAFSPDP